MFRVVLQLMNITVKHVDAIVMAICALHNYPRQKSGSHFCSPNDLDYKDTETGNIVQGQCKLVPLQRSSYLVHRDVRNIRDKFKNYFNNEGKSIISKKND